MDLLLPLWLPILLSAAAVWVISLIFGMALPHHKRDFIALPDPPGEDGESAVERAKRYRDEHGGYPPGTRPK